jgi:nitroimidazol reductase NimA-like FMN-containing flavoprotein (pyridoxamine 5'-phosphate oxidase superfamily)
MTQQSPKTEVHPDYSDPNAVATPWSDAEALLDKAELFWLSAVRPDTRPHVTPLIAVWRDGTLYVYTRAHERKAKHIAENPHVSLTTGGNAMHEDGGDIVIEGDAVRVTDTAALQRIADRYEQKYGPAWHVDVQDRAFNVQEGNIALVFAVAPTTAFGFGKGSTFSQTRWRF